MDILCPVHNQPLKIEHTDLNIFGMAFPAVIGICPKCKEIYINRTIQKSASTFIVNGNKYKFLQPLSNAVIHEQMKQAKAEKIRQDAERAKKAEDTKSQQKQAQKLRSSILDEQTKQVQNTKWKQKSKKHFKSRDTSDAKKQRLIEKLKQLENIPRKRQQNPPKKRQDFDPQKKLTKTNRQKRNFKDSINNTKVHSFDTNSPKTVRIFRHKNIAFYQSNDFEMITAMIPCANGGTLVPVTVYYRKSTNQYFINETTYDSIRNRYGLPYLKLKSAPSSGNSADRFSAYREHSELNLFGYSVSESSGLSVRSREELLGQLIDNGLLRKSDIVNHLEWLIRSRKNYTNMDHAIREWEHDLRFVNEYKMDKQRSILAQIKIKK